MCNNVNKICTHFHKNLPEQNIEKRETIVNYSCLQKREKTGKKIRPKPIKCVHISKRLPIAYDWEMIGCKTTTSSNIDEKWYVQFYTRFYRAPVVSVVVFVLVLEIKKMHKSFQNTTFPDAIYAKCLYITVHVHRYIQCSQWKIERKKLKSATLGSECLWYFT